MRILYLSHRIPFPPNKGDKIRSFNQIKFLSTKHEIDLGSHTDNPDDIQHTGALRVYCREVHVVSLNRALCRGRSILGLSQGKPLSVGHFYSKSLQAKVDEWLSLREYDAVICFCSPAAEYLFRSPIFALRFRSKVGINRRGLKIDHLQSKICKAKLVMDFCDVDSDKWSQYAKESAFPLNLIYRSESKLLLKYEKRVNEAFDYSVFVCQQEADLFSKLAPDASNVTAIPNGVDFHYFSPGYEKKSSHATHPAPCNSGPVLLFTGVMDYHANVDGVTWFCNEIFPLIRREHPSAEFYIVGSNPAPGVKRLADIAGVKVTGFVEDMRPYFDAADVCVIPLRFARGVQNKVLEAMSMAKPVVTTTKANQGIRAKHGEHLLVADSPVDFCFQVLSLFKYEEARSKLGNSARRYVVSKYSWETSMKSLEDLAMHN